MGEGITELEMTEGLLNNLTKALEEGKTFEQWNKDSVNILKNTGFGENDWYININRKIAFIGSSERIRGIFKGRERTREKRSD